MQGLSPSRSVLIAVMVAAMAGPFIFYTRDQAFLVLTVLLQELMYQGIYLLPCWLLGNAILRNVSRPIENGVLLAAGATALGLGVLGLFVLAFGLLGMLGTGTGWGLLIAMGVIGIAAESKRLGRAKFTWDPVARWFAARSEGGWVWLVPALLFSIPIVGATLIPGTLWRPDDPHPYDSLLYHLQVPREWFEAGRITPLLHNVFSFFPFNVEMHYLLANHLRGGPWQAMQQAQFFSISMTLVAAAGVWGLVRQHAGARPASIAAAAFLSVPWVLMLACVSYVESGMLMWSVMAIAWFACATRTGSRAEFAVGGAFAGFACGAKLTAGPMLLVALPFAAIAAFVIARCLQKRPPATADGPAPSTELLACGFRRLLVGAAVFVALGSVTLSPWLIRNVAWCGNPVFPLAARQVGQAHFSDTQVERFERAHRPAANHAAWSARFERLAGQILVNWRYNYVLFPLAAIGLLLNRRNPMALMMAILAVTMGVFWITTTHLMGRFYVLGLIPVLYLVAIQPRRMLTIAAVLMAAAALNSLGGTTLQLEGLSHTSNLHELFSPYAEYGRKGLYGLQNYAVIDPPELRERMDRASEVVLAGDTQAFNRQLPMNKLRYCTVFDMNLDGGRDVFDACYGPPPAKCPHDVLLVIDEAESRRLARTYWQVPEIPVPPEGRFREYSIVKP